MFGGAVPYRPAEDVAFSVARFIQNGGSFVNYYMFHGGTNFGNIVGRFVATSYDYDAALNEYGLPREQKYTNLKNLHKAIKMCVPALVSTDVRVIKLGKNQEMQRGLMAEDSVMSAYQYIAPMRLESVQEGRSIIYQTFENLSIPLNCYSDTFNTPKIHY